MQRGKRTFIGTDILGKLLDIGPINRKQLAQPAVFVHRVNEIGRFRSCGIELQFVLQRDNIFDRNLIVGNIHLVIGLNPALPRRFGIEGKKSDLIPKKLLEALDKAISLPAFFHRAKTVFVVHIKNEIDGFLIFDQTAQDQAREKGLTRARFAKNTVAALHKAIEIDAHRRIHIQRRAHVEKPVVFFLAAKNARYILFFGFNNFGKMTGNRFHRTRFIDNFFALFQHEHGA